MSSRLPTRSSDVAETNDNSVIAAIAPVSLRLFIKAEGSHPDAVLIPDRYAAVEITLATEKAAKSTGLPATNYGLIHHRFALAFAAFSASRSLPTVRLNSAGFSK